MAKVIMTVGLPASGKSTWATEQDLPIVSSDSIRKEWYGSEEIQGDGAEVFAEVHKRLKDLLDSGKDAIIDATNISQKRRRAFCEEFKDYEKEAVYFDTPYKEVLIRNLHRDRFVPVEVVNRMYKNLQIPTISEGWDNVSIIHSRHRGDVFHYFDRNKIEYNLAKGLSYDDFITMMNLNNIDPFMSAIGVSQDNPHHSFSVSRHIYYVYDYIINNYKTGESISFADLQLMLWTAVFHDIGKPFCKSFYNYNGELKRYASFIGHENVSAQLACHWLWKIGYDDDFILKVVELVQLHMKLLNAGSKGIKRLKNFVTPDVYEKLVFFQEADKSAK